MSAPAVTLHEIAARLRKTEAWIQGIPFTDAEIMLFLDEAAGCCEIEIVADYRWTMGAEVMLRLRNDEKAKAFPDVYRVYDVEVWAPTLKHVVLSAMGKVIREVV